MISSLKSQKGNSAIITLAFTLVCVFILLALFDLCRMYIAGQKASGAADAAALAVSQELLFLSSGEARSMAEKIADESGCELKDLRVGYDTVEVFMEKDLEVMILERVGISPFNTIIAVSKAKVTYPWDRRLGLCRYYEFGYRPY